MNPRKLTLSPEQLGQAIGVFVYQNRFALGVPELPPDFNMSWLVRAEKPGSACRVALVRLVVGDPLPEGASYRDLLEHDG